MERLEARTGRGARVLCGREVQKSIEESARQAIVSQIDKTGRRGLYRVFRHYIETPRGGRIMFQGLSQSSRTDEQVRSMDGLDLLWIEESQYITPHTRELVYPTIFRVPQAEIWCTFNPRYRGDPVYQDFVIGRRSDQATVMFGNFLDLPSEWRSAEQEMERLACLRDEPDRYPHIWLGEPDDAGEARKVMSYALVQACENAWVKYERRLQDILSDGRPFVGLDIADTGADRNAMVTRFGPAIMSAERWNAPSFAETTIRADRHCREVGAVALYYDEGGGYGAGVYSHLRQLGSVNSLPYAVRGVNFGAAVEAPLSAYTRTQTNADYFARRNAQMAWALRQRATRTKRLMDGEDIPLEQCLFIDPSIERVTRELLKTQMSQPEWEENTTGHIVIDKAPNDEASPDLYDAVALAFAYDSRNGLRAVQ